MTQALHTLLEKAENDRDAALARLLRAEDLLARARIQAEQLQAYREDYRRRAPARDGRGASMELVRVHIGFMERLELAREQQLGQRQRAEHDATALREELTAFETRVAAVRKLLQRREQERRQREARRDQRHMDEAAAHLASRRPNAVGSL